MAQRATVQRKQARDALLRYGLSEAEVATITPGDLTKLFQADYHLPGRLQKAYRSNLVEVGLAAGTAGFIINGRSSGGGTGAPGADRERGPPGGSDGSRRASGSTPNNSPDAKSKSVPFGGIHRVQDLTRKVKVLFDLGRDIYNPLELPGEKPCQEVIAEVSTILVAGASKCRHLKVELEAPRVAMLSGVILDLLSLRSHGPKPCLTADTATADSLDVQQCPEGGSTIGLAAMPRLGMEDYIKAPGVLKGRIELQVLEGGFIKGAFEVCKDMISDSARATKVEQAMKEALGIWTHNLLRKGDAELMGNAGPNAEFPETVWVLVTDGFNFQKVTYSSSAKPLREGDAKNPGGRLKAEDYNGTFRCTPMLKLWDIRKNGDFRPDDTTEEVVMMLLDLLGCPNWKTAAEVRECWEKAQEQAMAAGTAFAALTRKFTAAVAEVDAEVNAKRRRRDGAGA